MAPYYKDGYLEAVLFIFIDGDKILVEHRPKDGGTETFIPNGKIEDFDFADGTDYRVAAMRREVAEEFDNHVEVVGYAPLGVFRAEAVKITFYGFLVTEWRGQIPAYTVEEGRKFAELEWIDMHDYARYLTFDTTTFFVEKVRELEAR